MVFAKKLLAKEEYNEYTHSEYVKGGNPLRIAVCDDETAHRDILKKSLVACPEFPSSVVMEEYSDGATLAKMHMASPYDIIFLDIEMDGLSGIETGHLIRQTDRKVIIILVTSYSEYMPQSFKLDVFDYITKPFSDKDISEVFCRALRKYTDWHSTVTLMWKDTSYTVDIGDIVSVEIETRHVNVNTEKSVYKSEAKLDYFDRHLSPYGFFRCHNSYLVNMAYIKDFYDNKITTQGGKDIHVSVRKKKEFLRAYNNYVTKYRI